MTHGSDVPTRKRRLSISTLTASTGRTLSVRSYKKAGSEDGGDGTAPSNLLIQSIGVFSMAMVVFCWVGGAEVTQALQNSGSYDKPFLLTWFNHSTTALVGLLQSAFLLATGSPLIPEALQKADRKKLFMTVAILAGIFLLADYCWFVALSNASVGVATTVFNTSCVFVYALSVAFLNEPISPQKVAAVLLAVGGVALISVLDQSGSTTDNSAGNTARQVAAIGMSVFCAFLYGVYEITFKLLTEEWGITSIREQVVAVNWLAVMIALFTFVTSWPGLFVVAELPDEWMFYENFTMPTDDQVPGLLASAAGTIGFTIFFGISLALLNPLAVSIGSTLTIPASAVTDYFMHGNTFNGFGVIGALMIVVSFAVLNDDVMNAIMCRSPDDDDDELIDSDGEPEGSLPIDSRASPSAVTRVNQIQEDEDEQPDDERAPLRGDNGARPRVVTAEGYGGV